VRIRALLVASLIAAASMLIATPAQAAPNTVYIYKVGVPPSFRTADHLRSIPERRGIHGSETAEVFAGVS
jgi:hypothetical protein